MDGNSIIVLSMILTLMSSINGFGQQTELGLNLHPGLATTRGWDPGMNGAALNFYYFHRVQEKLLIETGLEFGYCGWGSQGLISTGIRYGNVHALDAEMLNGIAFYQQGPSYVAGAGTYYTHVFFSGKNNQLILSAGLRYTLQPSYKNYSTIYSFVDLPVRLKWSRTLIRKHFN